MGLNKKIQEEGKACKAVAKRLRKLKDVISLNPEEHEKKIMAIEKKTNAYKKGIKEVVSKLE